MSAYACEPGAGSEPGAGWAWACAAAQDHVVYLMTRRNNEAAIEEALADRPELRLHPVYLDLPQWARWWKRGRRGIHVYYCLWQILAWRTGRRLHRQVDFDVAHHVTLAIDWLPAGVSAIPGLPFIWGPVGGVTNTPWALWRHLGMRGLAEELVRELVTRPARRLFGDFTSRRAALVLAQNGDVARRFSPANRVVVEPNVALDLSDAAEAVPGSLQRPAAPVAVFIGHLIPWKGLVLAIRALADPAASDWRLAVYGEGRDRRRASSLAGRIGVADRVEFRGWRPRGEVLAALHDANAVVHPSFHDAAGWAVAEAISCGVPVICLDRGGPPVLIAGTDGVAVPARAGADRSIAAALARVAAASSRRQPSEQWSISRLPALVNDWYEVAADSPAAMAVSA